MAAKQAIQREYSKQELVKKIKGAKKSLCIIGATVFDLDWADLVDKDVSKKDESLAWKFFHNEDFTIQILCESENLIAQYALLSQGDSSFSRGNLNGVKNKVVKVLKGELVAYAESNGMGLDGLEPPEDVNKQELTDISEKTIRSYIIDVVRKSDVQKEQLFKSIKDSVKKYFENEVNVRFAGKIIRDFGFNIANELVPQLSIFADGIAKEIEPVLLDCDQLIDLDFNSKLKTIGLKSQKIVFTYVVGNKNYEFDFAVKLKSKIHEAICKFSVTDCLDAKEINEELDMVRKQAEEKAAYMTGKKKIEYEKLPQKKQRLFIKNCYMPMPVSLIKIDDELFITQSLTRFDSLDKFQYVGNINSQPWKKGENVPYRSYWIEEYQNYYNLYFDSKIHNGVQKYSTEETKKGDRLEVIDIFNESRVRIGAGPRDAFLSNMGIVKSVVWALIFDRKGNMLIHQRALNAKDNRGLWDKSVGGHVGVGDLDTIEAVRREIAEELYTLEDEGQSKSDKIKWLKINMNKIVYLGDWDTSRYPDFKGLNLDSKEFYAFSLNYTAEEREESGKDFRRQIIKTKRVLPGGESVEAKCYADPYLCIVAEDFDLSKLQNSKYAMLTPNELKSCVLTGKIRINKETRYYDPNADAVEFKVTSDLSELVTNSSLWDDVVTEFSKRIKEGFKDSRSKK